MWRLPKSRSSFSSSSQSAGGEPQREISVNIGGVRLELRPDVLNRFPESRLAELANCPARSFDVISSLCDDYDPCGREFYFDRDPDSFKCIVEVYYFGEVHMKRGICPICFIKEMEFWKIDLSCLDECCKSNLSEKEEELAEIADKVRLLLDDLDGLDSEPAGPRRWQKLLWRLMEKPESSLAARVVAVVSFLFILVSSVVMCLGTIPDLQVEDAEGNRAEHPTLDAIETACIGWFTVRNWVMGRDGPRLDNGNANWTVCKLLPSQHRYDSALLNIVPFRSPNDEQAVQYRTDSLHSSKNRS
ncbi:hypothetical protein NFI96_007058 [Prochilodus magdalenae]|nr:hypothetical protein NFI96_007058 [Prochilodus magdalenae]